MVIEKHFENQSGGLVEMTKETKIQYHNRMIKEASEIQAVCNHEFTFEIMGDKVCKCGLIEGELN